MKIYQDQDYAVKGGGDIEGLRVGQLTELL